MPAEALPLSSSLIQSPAREKAGVKGQRCRRPCIPPLRQAQGRHLAQRTYKDGHPNSFLRTRSQDQRQKQWTGVFVRHGQRQEQRQRQRRAAGVCGSHLSQKTRKMGAPHFILYPILKAKLTANSCWRGTRRFLWFCLVYRSVVPWLLLATGGSGLCGGPRFCLGLRGG
jgi:hypothetical protein